MLVASASSSRLRNDRGVVAALAAMPPVDDATWPMFAAQVGESAVGALADPRSLRDAADQLSAHAAAEGCDSISGASQAGDQLAAAVASLHGLPLFHSGHPSKRVLVVDVVLATGASLAIAAARLASSGASEVRAAVLIDLGATAHQAGDVEVIEVGA